MINKKCFAEVLTAYKHDLAGWEWENEEYKWKAVKHFQENWDIQAVDFSGMLKNALAKTSNLLVSANNFPAGMIEQFADHAPEIVRAMFKDLFDESKDIYERIAAFKSQSNDLLMEYGNGAANHYQLENAISTYLWLKYPDRYYVYKFSEVKNCAEKLGSDAVFKKGAYTANLRAFISLYDEICAELKNDAELISIYKKQLNNDCYPDPELKTLTMDVGFYISRYWKEWYPKDYAPGISAEQWLELLKDEEVFTPNSLVIIKRLYDIGGQATCKQLAMKYGEDPGFYNIGSTKLAKRVAQKTGCALMEEKNEATKWWPILYVGRAAFEGEEGAYVWKLRDELAEAVKKLDMSSTDVGENERHEEDMAVNYWWLNANPTIWSFSNIAVGEEQAFTLYNSNHNKRRVFQNFLDVKVGDLVIGYESNPVKQAVALCKISAEQDGEKIFVEKLEGFSSGIDYSLLRNCSELENMEFFANPNGSLFKLTKEEYDFIMDVIREANPLQTVKPKDSYDKKDFLNQVYMSEGKYDQLVSTLQNKKNIILQGAPGVGKTFAARRLAYSIMGEKDEDRVEFVQFHQSYSYEDFVMGYRPTKEGFELQHGVFYRFCQKAANNPGKEYFFLIDEINRGNLSRIFGELLMLIEKDYRDERITLAYNGMKFAVPKNLYIIGMMNTADRSLALMDYALRRRFSFFNMGPAFDSEGFASYQKGLNNETFDQLIDQVKELNKEISRDKSLGNGFQIGHSYFCGQTECRDEWMRSIVNFDILPMLNEYWFDDEDKVRHWESILYGIIND